MTDTEVESGAWSARSKSTWAPPLDLAVDGLDATADSARQVGLERIRLISWRDLDHPEAGGSELHAHRIASLWAAAGLDVTLRSSAVPGAPEVVRRNGYRAIRRSGRYGVFPRTALSTMVMRPSDIDGLVEVWNGMPFFSPVWGRTTRMVFLHHVHAEMWRMTLPPHLARLGEVIEKRVAPLAYRHTRVVTLSESSRAEIVEMLGLSPNRVDVVPPGVDTFFSPGPGRSATPLVLAVGRLVPVKRFPMLVRALAEARRQVPGLRAVIAGEGYARPEVEAARREAGAQEWLELRGFCPPEELRELYRSAWVLASASRREGWGMSITEAAACGTPAVASDIAGHRDAVVDGVSGLLADSEESLSAAMVAVLRDQLLRERLRRAALARAEDLTWRATATGALRVLLAEHLARGRQGNKA